MSKDLANYKAPVEAIDDLAEQAMMIQPARAAQFLFYMIIGIFITTFIWASVAKLDRVTRGAGWIVTSNQLQEVEYLEGGIVKEILVSAGDHVEQGELLIKLDPTQLNVEFTQGRDGYHRLIARMARLEAEATLAPVIFPGDVIEAAPQIVAAERALYEARSQEFDAAIALAASKHEQSKQALADAQEALTSANESASFATEEFTMMTELVDKGLEPRVELMRAQQRNLATKSEKRRADIAVERAQFEISEALGEIDQIEKAFAAAAADELSQTKSELQSLKDELPALRDKVARTDVRAPIAGVVNRVLVSTIGGVVAPGESIVEIVPTEDTLLVEAQIRPADIGFLREGQTARVSLSAYDQSIYGALDGVIENISADAIEEEKSGERFYKISVRTDTTKLISKHGDLTILPGMAAEVSILNGKRTVLAYIMKPLAEVGQRALQDQ